MPSKLLMLLKRPVRAETHEGWGGTDYFTLMGGVLGDSHDRLEKLFTNIHHCYFLVASFRAKHEDPSQNLGPQW